MATQMMTLCETSDDLLEKLKKFNFRKEKTLAAIIIKINTATGIIECEEEFEDVTIEDIAEELPSQQPRYMALSYPLKHDDGRVSYPLIFIYISPPDISPKMQMMYAGSKIAFKNSAKFTKEMEFRSLEEFTEEAILEKLKR